MANNETTTKFRVDIAELKKNFQEAQRQIRLANSEFKAATSTMDNWGKSADGIGAKINQLNSILNAQKNQLKSLEKQYELTAREQGENSRGAQELLIRINNQRAAIGNTERQISDYNNRLSEMTSESNDAETAIDKLKNTISDQEEELEKLKKQYANTAIEQGENSDAARALASQIESLSSELNDNRHKLSDAESAADDFDHTLDEVEDSADDAADGFTVMKGALADLVAEGIKAAIQGFKDLAAAAKEAYDAFDEGYDNLIKATGATGDTAKDLEKSYKNVAKSVKGEFGDIGSALGEVNTRFGYTGDKLEEATVAFMKFADITGTDSTQAVQLVSRAMGDAGIDADDYAEVLDELAIAAQASGISVDKLTENLTKYGAPMRALGFDTKEAIAIFSQWEKAGVNTEIAFSGMKTAISNWSKEGKDAKEEFKKTLDEIASAPDIASATTKAIEVFGKKAGPDLADAIKGGRFEYSEFLKILEGSEGTVVNTYEQTQDGFDKISLAAQGLKADVGDAFKNMMEEYGPEFEDVIEKVKGILDKGFKTFTEKVMPKIIDGFKWISDHSTEIKAGIAGIAAAFVAFKAVTLIQAAISAFSVLATVIQTVGVKQALLNAIMAANPIGLVVAAIAGLVAAFVVLWNKSEDFRNFWIGLWESIQETLFGFFDAWIDGWNMIKDFFINLWENITDAVKNAWESAKKIWNEAPKWFNDKIILPVKNFFGGLWDTAKKGAKLAWDGIKSVFTSVPEWFGDKFSKAWQKVKDVFSTGGKIFDGIKDGIVSAFKIVVNAIIRGINKVVSIPFNAINGILKKIKNVSIAGVEPFKNLISTFDVPQIPELREGGVLRKGKTGFLEGDGDEAVVPLEKNTGWLDEVASRLYDKMNISRDFGPQTVTNNVVNNFNQTNNSPKSLSRLEIYRQSKNLLRMKR